MAFRDFRPGVRVKCSGKHLRNTGQVAGGEGHERFTVLACDCSFCSRGSHVAVDRESLFYSPEEIAADPRLKWRHFAKEALTVVGQLDSRNCP